LEFAALLLCKDHQHITIVRKHSSKNWEEMKCWIKAVCSWKPSKKRIVVSLLLKHWIQSHCRWFLIEHFKLWMVIENAY